MTPSDQASSSKPWALVTGGSRGIGRAVALHLATRGWNVAIAYLRNDAAANSVAEAARREGAQVFLYQGNLARTSDCEELAEQLGVRDFRLAGLVHCAALGAASEAMKIHPGRWEMIWNTHVRAFLDVIARTRPLFDPVSSVVALTSLGVWRVMPGYAPIAAAKAALESLVKYLAVELFQSGINVNAVCGGPVDTDSLRSLGFSEELESQSRLRLPGRLGRPEDLAPIIGFLLSPEARWIRGQVLIADGGFSLH